MASNGFKFKQFFIAHDKCAMKVGTDSIVLGSWVDVNHAHRILDIGTGSGLLAIMLAQKCATSMEQDDNHIRDEFHAQENRAKPFVVTAIEPEKTAFLQAKENVALCPWSERINVYPTRLQDWLGQSNDDGQDLSQRFDLIVCNPPYFASQSMRDTDHGAKRFSETRRLARHRDLLGLSELAIHVNRLLSSHGAFYCILPAADERPFELEIQRASLVVEKKLFIKSTPNKAVKRIAWKIGKRADIDDEKPDDNVVEEHLIIYSSGQEYSVEYRQLCQGFYLKF